MRIRPRSLTWLLLLVGLAAPLMAGTPGLQVFFAADFKDQAYQQKTFKRVASVWKMPKETPEPGSKSVVVVEILKNGKMGGMRLHHSSGSDPWDAAAIKAVEEAAPFGPLPKSYPRSSVEAHFHFEYAR